MTCGFLIGRPSLLESRLYSRIAVAEVSELLRNSDALRRKSPTASGTLIFHGFTVRPSALASLA